MSCNCFWDSILFMILFLGIGWNIGKYGIFGKKIEKYTFEWCDRCGVNLIHKNGVCLQCGD